MLDEGEIQLLESSSFRDEGDLEETFTGCSATAACLQC